MVAMVLALFPWQLIGAQAPKIQFTDITAQSGITFKHVASPDKRYIVESMSGGVALFDYDNDGDLDVYFVNSLTVDLVKSKSKTQSALYRNDGDGKFTDVSAKAGVSDIGWGMGVAVGDYNNDGFEDLYVTCLGPNHLLKNNGDGTFSDVTDKAGVSDPRWSTGAAFVDYDNDGDLDLFVSNYVNFARERIASTSQFPCNVVQGAYRERAIRFFAITAMVLSLTFQNRLECLTQMAFTGWELSAAISMMTVSSIFSLPTIQRRIFTIGTMATVHLKK
jgi:hypothetical protein